MRIITRLFLKRELRIARRGGDAERQAICELALRDSDFEYLVHDAAAAQYEYERDLAAGSYSSYDAERLFGAGFADFFQWMIDHREEILEFLQVIFTLFSMFAGNEDIDSTPGTSELPNLGDFISEEGRKDNPTDVDDDGKEPSSE